MVLDPADPGSQLGAGRHEAEPKIAADMAAALYYTSGTTGQPKGVVHTHASLIADALQSPPSWEYAFEGVRSLAITPLFHIAAHTIFFPVLFLGGTLIVDAYNTEQTLAQIGAEDVNAFFAVPSILLLMVDRARTAGRILPGVKTVMFGAAPMTISKLGEVRALFPNAALVHGMGQTESGGTLVTLPGVAAEARAGSVGLPMPGVEVAIFDSADRPVPVGQVGELVARGPNLMLGYYRNDEATRATLANGWLHTGDLGYQDAQGLVTLVDRKKDMIIRGGENIYSCEVEQVLLRHPAIKAVAVVGQSDVIFGEQVAAFVVADPALPRPGVEELAAHCRFSLADYKVPVTIRFADALPLTATGKIRKAELRDSLPPYERARTPR
jgi:acyl-CoA synthetase (AMP-forming)/AMP-acid ligase II